MQLFDEPWVKDWYQTFLGKRVDPITTAMYYLATAGYGEPLTDYEDKTVDGWVFKILKIGEGDYLEGKKRLMKAILSFPTEEKKRQTIKRYYARMYNHYISFIPKKEMPEAHATAMGLEQWYEIGITEADAIFEEADD